MVIMDNDDLNVQKKVKEENIYEDEINLMDYFFVIWKRKWFIILVSVLSALAVGLVIFLGPREYNTSYTYDMALDEKDFKILEDEFYSEKNLGDIVGKLQEAGFGKYAKKIVEAKTAEILKEFVSFKVSPLDFDAIKSSEAKDFEELQKIQQMKDTLLIMQIVVQSNEDIYEIASIFRSNFEQIISLYSEKQPLNDKLEYLKNQMANIEESRYMLNQELERKKDTFEKLKVSGSETSEKLTTDIVLQFDIAEDSDNSIYLPLPYQIQAKETQIINLEEQIRANKESYEYYSDLFELTQKLFSHAEMVSSKYTIVQFQASLIDMLASYKESPQLQDYLKAYIKRVENKITKTVPLVEKPMVYSVAKGTIKKTVAVFVIALMMSVFVAFLLEGIKNNQDVVS